MNARKKISIDDFRKDKALGEHILKGKRVAQALDANVDALPYARVLTSHEFQDFVGELTPKRFELLRLASRGGKSISELADACHRDHSAVSKDVARLKALGLVKVESVSNAGHGQKKLVMPIARTITINASLFTPVRSS